ncbi:MAG: hypothetical protein HZA90_21965 [Verrucomicrobia bacterium]|nr:hypothetical protein [Verrucomicrobiota bacterium]
MRATFFLSLGLLFGGSRVHAAEAGPFYVQKPGWAETLLASRAALSSAKLDDSRRAELTRAVGQRAEDAFPVEWDWALQDFGPRFSQWFSKTNSTEIERQLLASVLGQLGEHAANLRREFETLRRTVVSPNDARWLNLYTRAGEQRRALRLQAVRAQSPRIVFTKHHTVRPSFFAYTEGQSDAQDERHFLAGAELCLLELDGPRARVRTLLADPTGAIRDPAVSWDGQRVVFAWKKSLNEDDYHLYELEVASGRIRQLTFGLGFADFEPACLPDGDIVFSSTRCVQTVDCWWTEVSNLYTCDADGRFLRRLGFDQVHTVFPAVLDDGRVTYTRWDYNDRGQIFPQALFQMNPDGTGQAEFYGNNSWFPTTIMHARGIPGTQKALAILCGHHSTQAGKLAVIDPGRGRHENAGVQLVAPVRATPAERIDSYGQEGELWQYPFPLSETEFLVTYAPSGWQYQDRKDRRKGDADFGIYWMDRDGHRELLVSDPRVPCQQPVPLAARPRPMARPSTVDYRKTTGAYYVQDVYAGPGLAGVARGTVKRLRVVGLEFRPAGVGHNGSGGPGGGALISTPVAIGNGTWDVKVVLGDATVHADGSAFFTVPARTPVYFQALDAQDHAVQTMRSWSTLQPGENQSCVGCHEHKNSAPPTADYAATLALKAGPQTLEPFYGPARGFSFPKEVQPIFDRHCIRCHHDRSQRMAVSRLPGSILRESDPAWDSARQRSAFKLPPVIGSNATAAARAEPPEGGTPVKPAFSLRRDETIDHLAKRRWSDAYLNLTLARPANDDWDRGAFAGLFDGRVVNWIGSQSIPAPLPPFTAGACRSELLTLLATNHCGVRLTREELDKIACWIDLFVPYCGDYIEANAWSAPEAAKYQHYADKRKRMEEVEQQSLQELDARQPEAAARRVQ